MAEFIKTKNWGKENIRIESFVEFIPMELHLKEDGDINGKPSFCMVLRHPYQGSIHGQFSLKTLTDSLLELGYELKKIEK